MDFFKALKRKLFLNRIFLSALLLFFSVILAAIGIRMSLQENSTSTMIVIMIGAISVAYFAIHRLFNNTSYNELVEAAKRLGELENVGEFLMQIPSDPRAYGDLRFTDEVIFYRNKDSAHIVITTDISDITTFSEHKTIGRITKTFYEIRICGRTDNLAYIEAKSEDDSTVICNEMRRMYMDKSKNIKLLEDPYERDLKRFSEYINNSKLF